MKNITKDKLFEAWQYCDDEDKSTEFMFAYMSDVANIDYDRVVQFVTETTIEERQKWLRIQRKEEDKMNDKLFTDI